MRQDISSLAPPEHFREPERFVTDYDAMAENADYGPEQYQKGLALGGRSHYIAIAASGAWSALERDGGMTAASERIGCHACTADLLRGFLDSQVPIVVYRMELQTSRITHTWIQDEPPPIFKAHG